MRPFQKIALFHDTYPLVGPIIWMLSVHYYIVQFIVAQAWTMPFSLRFNTISDLGNTACGQYGDRLVCSPKHSLMNMSFILLGLIMMSGSVLIYQEFTRSKASRLGFSMMAAAGFGTMLVGLFPENTIGLLHFTGAGLAFLIGNIGVVILGRTLPLTKWLRYYTLLSGTVSLVALALFLAHAYFGLGQGGMERITAYPQTAWLIVFGLYISINHFRSSQVLI